MRRSTAISQVLLLLAFYVVPLFAGTSIALPACCRRNGAHHCTMQEHGAATQTAFGAPVHCPYRFPAIVLTHATKLFLCPSSVATALLSSHQALLHDSPDHALVQLSAALENRGPPTLTL